MVLPGLDTDLDDEAWQTASAASGTMSIGKFTTQPASNHPQFAMHALLERFGIKRRDVELTLGRRQPSGREVLAVGGDAATRCQRPELARPAGAAGCRRENRRRHEQASPWSRRPIRRWKRWRSRWRCARRAITEQDRRRW